MCRKKFGFNMFIALRLDEAREGAAELAIQKRFDLRTGKEVDELA
jgi:hypothetical protein